MLSPSLGETETESDHQGESQEGHSHSYLCLTDLQADVAICCSGHWMLKLGHRGPFWWLSVAFRALMATVNCLSTCMLPQGL